jgi:hypothetical protein
MGDPPLSVEEPAMTKFYINFRHGNEIAKRLA